MVSQSDDDRKPPLHRRDPLLSDQGPALLTRGAVRAVKAVTLLTILVLAGAAVSASEASTHESWQPVGGPLSFGSWQGRAVPLDDGQLLYIGGFDAAGAAVAASQIYSPVSDAWSLGPSLTFPRGQATATKLNDGRVLVAGGYPNAGASELWEPGAGSGSFRATAPLNSGHTRHGAALLAGGDVLVAGGYAGCMTSAAEVFSPATEAWTGVGSMLTSRADFVLVPLQDGRVLAAGGDNDCAWPRKTRNAEVYDPETRTWSAVAPMTVARAHYAATLLADGRVLVVGGDNDSGMTPSAELYDPVTDAWTRVADLHRARFFGIGDGAWLLADGRVLVAGSDAVGDGISTSEIFDPASGTWSAPVPLTSPRCGPAATTTLGGVPVLIGGNTCGSPVTLVLSAERWSPASDGEPPVIVCDAAPLGWQAANVAVPCTAHDGGVGLADPADASFSLMTSVPAGTTDPDASTDSREVCDAAGNCATAGPITNIQVDREAPLTTVTLTGATGSNGWYLSDVTLALDASDTGSGVVGTYYQVDGDAVQTYAGALTLGNGVHIVSSWSVDAAGHTEAPQTTSVAVDTVPLACTAVATPSIIWPANKRLVDVSIAVTTTVGPSGVAAFSASPMLSDEAVAVSDIAGFATPAQWSEVLVLAGQVRADRNGGGDGRLYTQTYALTSGAGQEATCVATVAVLHHPPRRGE